VRASHGGRNSTSSISNDSAGYLLRGGQRSRSRDRDLSDDDPSAHRRRVSLQAVAPA